MLFILIFALLLGMFRATAQPAREPRWASLRLASEYSTIPIKTLRDWIAKGRLPAYRFGPRQLRVDLNDLDALVRKVPTAGMEQ